MHHFFTDNTSIDRENHTVRLTGDNYRHLVQVLRARPGEKILISDGEGSDYECTIREIHDMEAGADGRSAEAAPEVLLHIDFVEEIHELPARIYLFQGLPKQDKMELIVQKAVELGAYAVVPLDTQNTVVKLDAKRAEKKRERWQAIAEAAAKQSKRSIIPELMPVMTWEAAMRYVEDFDLRLIPYENAKDIRHTMEALQRLPKQGRIAVFIGPEGGFSEREIEDAQTHDIEPITLGKRILRTETAAIAAMSILMLTLESKEEQG